MAATNLLTNATADTTGAGVQLTGDFEVSVSGTFAPGARIVIERSVADQDADYTPVGVEGFFWGKGHAAIKNTGANYYRAKLTNAGTGTNVSVVANQ